MSLAVMTMPDDTLLLPQWLDEQIVGDRLADLVAELAAANSAVPPLQSVRTLLGNRLSAVMERGLSALPPEQVRQLIRQPQHLFELQELAFVEGGRYWATLSRPAALSETVRNQWTKLQLSHVPTEPSSRVRERRAPSAWLVSLATAAAVLVGVAGVMQFFKLAPGTSPVAAVGWGWAKPDGLPKNPDAKGYLNALADAGDEWFKKQPDTTVALAQRINEYRQGCSVLLLADHPALSDEQKTWLRERCRKWAGKFDESLARLEAGTDVTTVRAEADATAKALSTALRAEAAKM